MKDGYGKIIAEIIIIWLIASLLSKLSLQGSRSKADMVKFDDGYCYHEESHIIYIEQVKYGANYTYTPYYDKNGKMNVYDVATGEWIPID